RSKRDWSSDVCSSDLLAQPVEQAVQDLEGPSSSLILRLRHAVEAELGDEAMVGQELRHLLGQKGPVGAHDVAKRLPSRPDALRKIGRASCRERVWISV